MLWVLVIALAASLFALIAARQARTIEPHALGLDFGDSPELVEYTLRAVANKAEREGICHLNVYLEARDEECKRIALRLCEYIPVCLHMGAHAAVPSLRVAGQAGNTVVQEIYLRPLVYYLRP